MNGCWPASLVLQNCLPVSFTTPVAWTVAVLPLAIALPSPCLRILYVVA